jgi:hypothetical protein
MTGLVRRPTSLPILNKIAGTKRNHIRWFTLNSRYSDGYLPYRLDVVIELELCWMWTQAHVVNFSGALVMNPGIDQVLSEYATLG